MANGSHRGGQFERDICTQLSLWWTKGTSQRDDVLWRSEGSGARATVRNKAGKTRDGQWGDIAATDASCIPLLDVFTFELKRGYPQACLGRVFNKLDASKQQDFEKFIAQAATAAEGAGSVTWALVTRQQRRETMITLPAFICSVLKKQGAFKSEPSPLIVYKGPISYSVKRVIAHHLLSFRLVDFCKQVHPNHVRAVSEKS